jgi:hypothetical protein
VLQPTRAVAGEKISVIGTGFAAGDEITVGLGDRTVAYATAQERGSFVGQFVVPAMRAGIYLVGVKVYKGQTLWAQLLIASHLGASKTAGELGATVKLNGTSFIPNTLVDILYDSKHVQYVATDGAGTFSTEFVVPVGEHGPHIITATDGMETQQVVYTVESQPPAVPVPLSPRRGAEVIQPVALSWEAVYDISQPLTYSLQISRDEYFLRPLMTRTGLTVSHYTLSDIEKLAPNRKGEFYYWHVRATDGASNEGEWSEAASFRIKAPEELPRWGKPTLIGVMVIILFLYGIQLRQGLNNAR